MAMQIDLHFSATSVEELRKQLKQAYEGLAGPVVETPKKIVTTPVVTEKAPEPKIEGPKKRGRKKKPPFRGPCKDCGTTTTPQWRRKSKPEGPLCNRCGIIRVKEELKAILQEPTETPKERSVRIREQNITRQTTGKKKTHAGYIGALEFDTIGRPLKKAKVPNFVPAPKEEVQLTTASYLTWCQHSVPGMIMRDRAFLVATKVIETWFIGLKAQSEFNDWMLTNQEQYVTATMKIFNAYQADQPTMFLIQDAGDNIVLMVNNPSKLQLGALNKVSW